MALLSVDIGTTGTKAILFSETGEMVFSSYQEYSHIYPRPGWAELDSETIWTAVQKTVRDVSDKHQKLVEALAISCMGNNIVPVRQDGTAIRNGILAFDTRSTEEVAIIKDTIGDKEYFQITGSRPSTLSGLSKILWLKRSEPDNFSRTWKFFTFADFILMRIGFPAVIDYSLVSSSTPFDIRRKEYSDTILKEFGLSSKMFSEPLPSGHVLGEIGLAARTQLGLPKGVKVVTGGHDVRCGALGAGVTHSSPQVLANMAGTYESAAYVRTEPILNQQAFDYRVNSYYNVINDTYGISTALPTSGSIVRWFRNELASEERIKAKKEKSSAYDIMFEPLKFNGGTIMVVPYFSGSSVDSYARGAFLGLTLDASRQKLLKGIVEGVTHELKLLVDRLQELSPTPLEVIRAVGGSTRSQRWLQLKADITGKTVEALQVEEASALGAALLSGVAIGVYDSIEQAIKATVRIKDTYRPRPEIYQIYDRQHEVYKRLVEALRPLNKELYHM